MPTKFELDPHSPMPLYYQVYTSIMDRIASTEFKPGQLLPSERVLVEQYGVSRITVSRAMDLLKEEGVIRLRHGKGHYVNRQKLYNDPTSRASLADYMRQQGIETHWEILERQWLSGPDMAAIGLNLAAGRKYYQARLIMHSSQKPIGFYYVYVPGKIARDNDVESMGDQELLDFLRDSPTVANCRRDRTMDAMLADGDEAEALRLEKGAALMRIDIRYISPKGNFTQAMRCYYRGDSFSYKF